MNHFRGSEHTRMIPYACDPVSSRHDVPLAPLCDYESACGLEVHPPYSMTRIRSWTSILYVECASALELLRSVYGFKEGVENQRHSSFQNTSTMDAKVFLKKLHITLASSYYYSCCVTLEK